ncbi:hypothetical protein [Paenibacillus rhizolycopersici]|uniref:hypothetical protein n=1 Tax=Paenibacillus rhizolycopersici TaxID=2780073 RepID=UPI003D2D05AC
MKKTDWFIVILFVAMGLSCLVISASSFRGISFFQMGFSIGKACLAMMGVVAIMGIIYWLTQKKKP